MTPSEFKAWFGGFTEALDGTPSEEQWKRIKARVAEIDGRPVTEHIYVHRYMPYYYSAGMPVYWQPYNMCGTLPVSGLTTAGSGSAIVGAHSTNNMQSFNSHAAMLSLGRAEAASMNS